MSVPVQSGPSQDATAQLKLPFEVVAAEPRQPGALRAYRRRILSKQAVEVVEQTEPMPQLFAEGQFPSAFDQRSTFDESVESTHVSKFVSFSEAIITPSAANDSPINTESEGETPRSNLPQNLADVMSAITADTALTKRQRTDFQSALRGLAQVAVKDLALIPTIPDVLRKLFRSVVPAAHGISDNRWCHIRSRVICAMRHAGAPIMPGRSTAPISFAWAALFEALSKSGKAGLSRFMRYCTDCGIDPDAVNQAVFDSFLEVLQTRSTIRSPAHSHRSTCIKWNSAVASVAGWPAFMVAVSANDRRYALDWSTFPECFRQDVEAYFTRAGSPDPFDDEALRTLRPSTILHQRKQILEMASLLVLSGIAPENVTELSVLVAPETAKRILKAAQKRLGNESSHLGGMAQLLRTVAKHWCRCSEEIITKLGRYAAGATPKWRGMTPKNRERLRQFDDAGNLLKLLLLPQRTFNKLAAQKEPDFEAARRAMYALAVAILTEIPVRSQNLIRLDRSRHIIPVGHKRRRLWHLVIPAHEIKNDEPIEALIPSDVAALMEAYQQRYLPLICKTSTNLLFPNDQGDHRYQSSFVSGVCAFIKRETGLIMNVHLFRHLAVTTYLHRHPEDIETARRILGHKNITTTIRYYALLKQSQAFRRYSAMIAERRAENGRPLSPIRGKTRGGQ